MEGRGEEGQGRKRGKGREEGGEGMIRNDRPSPHQKILDPPLARSKSVINFLIVGHFVKYFVTILCTLPYVDDGN
jgi:hypothetical protein